MCDDLNTPAAIAGLPLGAALLGVGQQTAERWFHGGADAAWVGERTVRMAEARAAKDWAAADALRSELKEAGIEVSIGRDGRIDWRRA